jgi:hypothetical protein
MIVAYIVQGEATPAVSSAGEGGIMRDEPHEVAWQSMSLADVDAQRVY